MNFPSFILLIKLVFVPIPASPTNNILYLNLSLVLFVSFKLSVFVLIFNSFPLLIFL